MRFHAAHNRIKTRRIPNNVIAASSRAWPMGNSASCLHSRELRESQAVMTVTANLLINVTRLLKGLWSIYEILFRPEHLSWYADASSRAAGQWILSNLLYFLFFFYLEDKKNAAFITFKYSYNSINMQLILSLKAFYYCFTLVDHI